MVEFLFSHHNYKANANPFNDHTLISILQLLSTSPMPPHELHFGGGIFGGYIPPSFWNKRHGTIPLMQQIVQSFFSKTLTILHLTGSRCHRQNVPLPIFVICPRLREVFLDNVESTYTSYDGYPDSLCSGREPPPLEVLNYRNSQSLVKQMITPPPKFFNTPVVVWSNLRILTLSPHEEEGMACLQPILDAACNTLEELYLTSTDMGGYQLAQHLSLVGLLNLSNLLNLHVFSLCANIACYAPLSPPPKAVLQDINLVLSAISESNKVTNLWFDLTIVGTLSLDVLSKIGLDCSTKSSVSLTGSLLSWNYR